MTHRVAPPLRTVVARITFIAPLWGILITVGLLTLAFLVSTIGASSLPSVFEAFGFGLMMLIPALIVGYPIGMVIALVTALVLVLVVRRFGWSRRNALLTALLPGAITGVLFVANDLVWVGLGAVVVCVGAGALTWWSSLRGLLDGSSERVAEVFS